MKFSFYIARRYLVSKRSRNAINIISIISVVGVAVGTAALVIVLSVFNGFDDLIHKLYNSFDPDIKIVAEKGKTFIPDAKFMNIIENTDYIKHYSFTLEEKAMLKYEEKAMLATVKGVDENYSKVTGIDTMITRGEYDLFYKNTALGVAGMGIAYNLGLDFDFLSPVSICVPSRNKELSGNFQDLTANLNIVKVYTSAAFSIQQEYDTKYFIIPLWEMQKLLEYDKNVSAIEIQLNKNVDIVTVTKKLQSDLGSDYKILDRNKQHESAYKVMKSEKWTIFMILTFILVIASFNIIGSLTMIIIDKKNDISILKTLGTDNNSIRQIFFFEGIFISSIGAVLGIVFGLIICWAQIEFGLIKLGTAGDFIIENYPVLVNLVDVLYVFVVVLLIGAFAAWYPVKYITKRFV